MFGNKKLSFFAVLLIAAMTIVSCGDGGGSEGEKPEGAKAEAIQRRDNAGNDVAKLDKVREWIKEKAAEKGPDKLDLQLMVEDIKVKIVESFRTLVRNIDESDESTASQLRAWADDIIARSAKKEAADRDPLAKALEREMDYLWSIALKADPNNVALREKLGYIEHTKDLNSYLELSFMDEDSDIKHIKDLIEAVAEDLHKSPDGKKWLPKDFQKANDYKNIDSFVAKLKAAHDEKLKDPFTKAAFELLADTIEYLNKAKQLTAFRWVGRVHHPYLFIIESDSAWDETDVAEKKAKQLNELIDLFHNEYEDVFQLSKITKPMPIIVFKRFSSYRQYSVGKALTGALGHFEHGSERIVLSDQAQRGTLFHEGTHQLVTYHTKGDTIRNFLSRSYWFQEGVAEYFGATAARTDKKTKELRFDLGTLQTGRLNYWRQNEESAYNLWDLIGLTFADRQANIAAGKQNKNLMVYSQGWLLVYFLYNFNADANDMVQISDKPTGKYKKGFLTYMKGELNGTSGRDDFLKCLGLWDDKAGKVDSAKWDKFELEFVRYYNWINRKVVMKHVRDGKLIAWDKIKHRIKDIFIGDKEDDILPEETLNK